MYYYLFFVIKDICYWYTLSNQTRILHLGCIIDKSTTFTSVTLKNNASLQNTGYYEGGRQRLTWDHEDTHILWLAQ